MNFETSVQPAYRCQINSITYQSDGGYITAGFYEDENGRTSSLSKYDSLGSAKWTLNKPDSNVTAPLIDLINLRDSNLVVSSYIDPCDVGLPLGILKKYSRAGILIWKLKYNKPLMPNHIKELRSGKLIFSSDSSLYCLSTVGDSLWSLKYNHGLIYSIQENLSKEIIIGTEKGIIKADSNGTLLNFYSFPQAVKNIIPNIDSTYLITTGNSIERLNKIFGTSNTLDVSSKYSQLDILRKSVNGLWVAGKRKSDSAPLIAKIDSSALTYLFDFSFADSYVRVNDMNINGKKLVVAGSEAGYRNSHQFIKSFDYLGNCPKHNIDIGVTNMQFDTIYLSRSSNWPGGIYNINFKPRVTVKNYGDTVVRSFSINTNFYLASPICGESSYTEIFDSIILPGDSIVLFLPLMSDGFAGAQGGIVNYSNFCIWTSAPNNNIDKNHSNDASCTSFSVPVSINEISPLERYIKIFPNPTPNKVQLTMDQLLLSKNILYQLFDITGRIIESGLIIKESMEIKLPEDNGIYLLKITNEEHSRQIKLIKN